MYILYILYICTYVRTSSYCSDIEYAYYVKRVPYVDYVIKQVEPVRDFHEGARFTSSPDYRMQRKRYAIRVEFEQSGHLGECMCVCMHVQMLMCVCVCVRAMIACVPFTDSKSSYIIAYTSYVCVYS